MSQPAVKPAQNVANPSDLFRRFSHKMADAVGSPAAFLLSLVAILIWGLAGPSFHFSDTWQLVINTGTTIITFLMVFLIQNTQNRDSRAVHLKLDELIRSTRAARNEMLGLENLSDEDLDALQQEFARLHDRAERNLHTIEEHRSRRKSGNSDEKNARERGDQ